MARVSIYSVQTSADLAYSQSFSLSIVNNWTEFVVARTISTVDFHTNFLTFVVYFVFKIAFVIT